MDPLLRDFVWMKYKINIKFTALIIRVLKCSIHFHPLKPTSFIIAKKIDMSSLVNTSRHDKMADILQTFFNTFPWLKLLYFDSCLFEYRKEACMHWSGNGSAQNWHQPVAWTDVMMTSSNGNIFRVTCLLCGELTGHRWFPFTKASDVGL